MISSAASYFESIYAILQDGGVLLSWYLSSTAIFLFLMDCRVCNNTSSTVCVVAYARQVRKHGQLSFITSLNKKLHWT